MSTFTFSTRKVIDASEKISILREAGILFVKKSYIIFTPFKFNSCITWLLRYPWLIYPFKKSFWGAIFEVWAFFLGILQYVITNEANICNSWTLLNNVSEFYTEQTPYSKYIIHYHQRTREFSKWHQLHALSHIQGYFNCLMLSLTHEMCFFL